LRARHLHYVASLAETGRGARLGWFSSGNDIGATAGPLIADLASARRLDAATDMFGTIWDVGEAGGPIIAGFLIVSLGYMLRPSAPSPS
jgi:hypothetical protein